MIEVEETREGAIRREALDLIDARLGAAEDDVLRLLEELDEQIEGLDPSETYLKEAVRLGGWAATGIDMVAVRATQVLELMKSPRQRTA